MGSTSAHSMAAVAAAHVQGHLSALDEALDGRANASHRKGQAVGVYRVPRQQAAVDQKGDVSICDPAFLLPISALQAL